MEFLPEEAGPTNEILNEALLLIDEHDGKATKEEASQANTAIASPAVVLEKVDSEPRHGDDFGESATFAQKDAHKLRAQDAEPDFVVVRAYTPDIASVAAEVADAAAILDRDIPTPPISDVEAGRIGFRRMSETPISEVADTAAEVAETAAVLDNGLMVSPNIDGRRDELF